MVGTELTEKQIGSGRKLLDELDRADVLVDAALWFFFPEIERWKLLLSLPHLTETGPKAAYREVQKALSKLAPDSGLVLDDITVVAPDLPLLHLLRTAIKTEKQIGGVRLSKTVINGVLIEDAHIYRLT